MRDVIVLVGAGQIGMAISRRMGFGMKIVAGDYKMENIESVARTMAISGFDVIP